MKKLIGLTGKTGAGKSTVSSYLKDNGVYIIDGDIVARDILSENPVLINELKKAFGDILNSDGSLNRKALAKKAFSSAEKTNLLNSIMHPAINDKISDMVNKAFETHDIVVVDAAAIIESGFTKKCRKLIVVTAPQNIRLERIMRRDNISREDALVRINGQKDDDFYISKADYIIDTENGITKEALEKLKEELFN
ncbi:MAG: dephospho-CoA kinase [Acutalibacteraceae bacterium]